MYGTFIVRGSASERTHSHTCWIIAYSIVVQCGCGTSVLWAACGARAWINYREPLLLCWLLYSRAWDCARARLWYRWATRGWMLRKGREEGWLWTLLGESFSKLFFNGFFILPWAMAYIVLLYRRMLFFKWLFFDYAGMIFFFFNACFGRNFQTRVIC